MNILNSPFELNYWYKSNLKFISGIEYIIQGYCNSLKSEVISNFIISVIDREYKGLKELKDISQSKEDMDLDNSLIYDCLFEIKEYTSKEGTNMLSSLTYFDLYSLMKDYLPKENNIEVE